MRYIHMYVQILCVPDHMYIQTYTCALDHICRYMYLYSIAIDVYQIHIHVCTSIICTR